MHNSSMELMRQFRTKYLLEDLSGISILDVGSYDVNGTYKDLFIGASYVGLDIADGPNVDITCSKHDVYPLDNNSFDVVISGQALEHMTHPWKAVMEMSRILKSQGLICLIAPWKWPIHPYPMDCFRILPDGMKSLMQDNDIEVLDYGVNDNNEHGDHCGDCFGIGRKQ